MEVYTLYNSVPDTQAVASQCLGMPGGSREHF